MSLVSYIGRALEKYPDLARQMGYVALVEGVETYFLLPKLPGRTLVVIIDALDEAMRDGKNELAAFIAEEFPRTPFNAD